MSVAIAHIKRGREKSIRQGHPWVFSGSINSIEGDPQAGDLVRLVDHQGAFLATAGFSPASKIQLRIWSWQAEDAVDGAFMRARLAASVARRTPLLEAGVTNAVRLVHGESDHLPGLVVDHLNDVLVVQISSAALEPWRESIFSWLTELTGIDAIYERSDVAVRQLEGLDERTGWATASTRERTTIVEHGLRYAIDFSSGQKTGFYLDQRDNRAYVRQLAAGKDVLDAFCYSGGFALNALTAGARSVLAVDSSQDALDALEANATLNGLAGPQLALANEDVFAFQRGLLDRGQAFDVIVLDPPKFAPTRASAEKAARGYKDINLNAMKLLRAGGELLTFSCSGGIDLPLFTKIVAGAAADASRQFRIERRFGAAADHPVLLNFPEGEYLKGLHLKMLDA